MTKGNIIELDKVVVVTVVWCNETLMQVEYKDLTSRLLKIADYEIKILSEETRKDFEKDKIKFNIRTKEDVDSDRRKSNNYLL